MPLILQILYLPIVLLKFTRAVLGIIFSIPSFLYFTIFNVNINHFIFIKF